MNISDLRKYCKIMRYMTILLKLADICFYNIIHMNKRYKLFMIGFVIDNSV